MTCSHYSSGCSFMANCPAFCRIDSLTSNMHIHCGTLPLLQKDTISVHYNYYLQNTLKVSSIQVKNTTFYYENLLHST